MAENRDEIVEAVVAFVYAQSWDESKRIVEERQDVLLTDTADEILGYLLTQYQDDENTTAVLEEHRELLARCRREGIESAFASYLQSSAATNRDEVTDAVLAFVNAQRWSESKRIVEEYRDVLLTDAADEILAYTLTQYQGNENATAVLEEHRALLYRCRQEGIDSAFADRLQPPAATPGNELRALIQELNSPSATGGMPRRVAACQEALALIDRSDQPDLWAALHVELGGSLQQNPQGEKAENLEEAISHYEQALEVHTREGFPVEWAGIQNDLGIVYWERVWGEKADNIEKAIHHFEQALEVFTQQDFPKEWEQIQGSLATAYQFRIRGETPDMSQNREQANDAVSAFLKASSWEEKKGIVEERRDVVLTDAADEFLAYLLTQDWDDENATVILEEHRELLARCRREGIDAAFADHLQSLAATRQGELESLLQELSSLSAPDEMPRRIAVCRQALALVDRVEQPELWAGLQVELGNSLRQNPQGEKAENLEEAISRYQQALEVYTREALPVQWAATQNNLANAYSDRIRGKKAENIEQAISRYELALEIYTREALPEDWAMTQNNLATAYWERIRGERAHNIEEAISHYELALEIYTREALPEDWAMTQNNLATAYWERIRGERAANIEQAISRYELALEIRTREALPVQWAATQNNLANAYKNRIRGERAANIEEAISHYELALEIYTREALPVKWADTQNNLANAYWERIRGEKAENIEQAISRYKQALAVRKPNTLPQDCRDTAYALGSLLYGEGRLAEARVRLTTAHEAVEALRGELVREGAKQSLAEENALLYARLVHCCLMEDDEEAAFEYAVAGKGRAFVDMLATARFDLSAAGADDPHLAEDLRQDRELRQQIDNLLSRLTGEDGSSPDGDGEEQRSVWDQRQNELRSLEDQKGRHWEEMSFRYPALTATQQAPKLSAEEARRLSEEIGATLVEYYRHAGGWCAFVVIPGGVRYVPLPGVDEIREEMLGWLREVESQTGRNEWSYDSLRNLHQAVIAPLVDHLPRGGAVALAPFSWLHLVPLNAALDPATGRYATDDYLLELTPNLAALRVALDQKSGQDASSGEEAYERLLGVAYPGAAGAEHYLHNVLSEAEAVARHFPEYGITPLHEDDATPEAVLAHARGHDVIHFGCHGDFDPEAPEQSGLVLSGGWLTVQRVITELHLEKTRLATIGACLSGRVRLRRGEEHVGLVQAMMSAGAGAVVASLWPVDDAATRALFDAFYAGIKAGKSPAAALAGAARAVRSYPGWEHPYYWAAFQTIGLAHREDGSGASAR